MSKNKSYKILKVRDKNDSYYTPVDRLFDLPFRLLINGKSQLSGKTTIILNLLLNPTFGYDKMFDGDDIHIISNNKLDNKLAMMADKLDIPEENRQEFDEDYLEILYEDIEEEFMEDTSEGRKPKNKLIIFDDCGYSGSLKSYSKGNIVDKMICNGRHLNLSQIYTSQRFSQCSTCLRTNLTGAIMFSTSMKELELISEDFNYMTTKKEFIKIFRETTAKPREFMVINFSNPPAEMYLNTMFEPIKWK
tara:strand:+ start:1397 stop:2140 length:744 start_codon:yes stop_codon:yes gene_type:complete